ncbi:MAG: M23 family metallopeptidase [Pseudomonadota bacterium]|nr:M23 family metallopeptidase [Pseudomonadota bacterium]
MKRFRYVFLLAGLILIAGFFVSERFVMPVSGAGKQDWNKKSFWHEPWGRSGVHKGVDIFAHKGTPALAPVDGIVLFAGEISMGGKVVLMLGPKWRLHYLAHLDAYDVSAGTLLGAGRPVGTVGNTGNAKGKPSHLHYTILTLVPYPWLADSSAQGWKKMFFLDPSLRLVSSLAKTGS